MKKALVRVEQGPFSFTVSSLQSNTFLIFLLQALHQVMHGANGVHSGNIRSAESKTPFEIAFHGVDQRGGNAVRCFFLFAGFHAMENAFKWLFLRLPAQPR